LHPAASARQEASLNWNHWIRQIHRWLSIAFTLTVIVTFIALAQEKPFVWVSYVPLFPLAFLFLTGLYLFALPYATKWRGRRTV
jgi:heme A synthase